MEEQKGLTRLTAPVRRGSKREMEQQTPTKWHQQRPQRPLGWQQRPLLLPLRWHLGCLLYPGGEVAKRESQKPTQRQHQKPTQRQHQQPLLSWLHVHQWIRTNTGNRHTLALPAAPVWLKSLKIDHQTDLQLSD